MSFSVIGGPATPPTGTHSVQGSQKSLRVSTAMPPPFSLSAGNDVVDMLGSAQNGPGAAKRMGTDPAKFKTTICRNWEQTGVCSFRGCTFAHGVDDLRPPARSTQGVSPVLGPSKVSPNTSPSIHASAVHNSGNAAPTKLDNLVEQLVADVSRDKDLSLVHQEAYRTLDAMIRREQTLKTTTTQQVEGLLKRVDLLLKKLKERDLRLTELSRDASADIRARAGRLTSSSIAHIQAAEGLLRSHKCDIVPDPQDDVSQAAPPLPRSYAAAVTGSRPPPMALQPIGGSPVESSLDLPRRR